MAYVVFATATKITLTVQGVSFRGLPVYFTANVAPFDAAGSVIFLDGNLPLSPPVPVTFGVALFNTSALTRGTHTVTAVFMPTDPVAFGPVNITTQNSDGLLAA